MHPETGNRYSNGHTPIYNSRIMRVYVEFLEMRYPEVDIDEILFYSGVRRIEVDNPGFWYSQHHADRFHEIVFKKTRNANISREAGRYAGSSEALGALKQLLLGLMDPATNYMLLAKNYPFMSRGARIQSKRLGKNKVEITATPNPGVDEKRNQCQNRLGMFESLGRVFTGSLPTVEEVSCFHDGDDCCRYIIGWKTERFAFWKRVRNLSVLSGGVVGVLLLFLLPLDVWGLTALSIACLLSFVSFYTERVDKKARIRIMSSQGDAARDLLQEINSHHNDSLLVQEIGNITSASLDLLELMTSVGRTLEQHAGYDRGMIILVGDKGDHLFTAATYGFSEIDTTELKKAKLPLSENLSRHEFISAFQDKKQILLSALEGNDCDSTSLLTKILTDSARSFFCTPLIYEEQVLGLFVVDCIETEKQFLDNEVRLLMSIASQIAVCLMKISAFDRLRESEKRVRDSEEKYRRVVENANDAIFIVQDGMIRFPNPRTVQLTGYAEAELAEMPFADLVYPDDRSKVLGWHSEKTSNGNVSDMTRFSILTKSGDQLWVELNAVRTTWNDQPAAINFIRDLTPHIKLEEQLRQAQKMEAIGTLAGGIAHDFNNILFPLLGYSEMLKEDLPADSPFQPNVGAILQSTLRAKDLVQQILAFSRQSDQEFSPIKLQPIVKEAIKLLRATIPRTIDISQEIDPDCGAIKGNPTQMHQVIMNLSTNAFHALEDTGGRITIRLGQDLVEAVQEVPQDLVPGVYAELAVIDTGCGMGKEVLEKVYDPYFTTKTEGKGTGLGLSVVHGIVRSCGGDIRIDSTPGKGTAVYVRLPLTAPRVEKTDLTASRPIKGGSESILLVDDEEAIVRMETLMLERMGYRVTPRHGSIDALQAFKADPGRFDLVISDMTMPNMTGVQLAGEIKKIRYDVPVIICTGFSDQIDEEKCRTLGIDGYVMKPVIKKQIARHIRHILDKTANPSDN